MNVRSLALLACLGLGCREPFLVIPGSALEGEVRPAAEFAPADGYRTAQLETRLDDAYSVNVTCTVVGGRAYLNAGDSATRWARNAQADPSVRVRLDGDLYERRAVRVTDPDEIATFARAWLAQSSTRKDPTGLDELWLFRLDPR